MLRTLKQTVHDESGATANEHGLMAALVWVSAITAWTAMGGSLKSMFEAVSTVLSGAIS